MPKPLSKSSLADPHPRPQSRGLLSPRTLYAPVLQQKRGARKRHSFPPTTHRRQSRSMATPTVGNPTADHSNQHQATKRTVGFVLSKKQKPWPRGIESIR